MTMATLAIRFLIELIGIGAVGYWGFQAIDHELGRIALGIGAALALIVVWGLLIAPKATNPLTQPQRDLIGTGLLLLAAGALALAGQPGLALAFAAVVLIDWLIMIVLGPQAVEIVRPSAARVR
jgi:hypothetical protein